MLNVIHLKCIMEDFSTVKYKHSNTMYVPYAVYSHIFFQPSPINTVMCTIHCYTCSVTLRVQSNELNPCVFQLHICVLYLKQLSHVTHMIQMLSDSSLPDTNMIQAMWHTWYRWCLTPSTWYKHDTATTDTHATDLDPSLQGGKSGVHGVGFPPI